jgi:hypothetical protein
MASKQFTAKTFTWLRQINRGRYLAIDLKVALELTTYFNEKDQNGRAYPSCKTLGDAIGLSERTVRRSVERMHAQGDLYVMWGKQGRRHPHQYWMIIKDEKTGTAMPVSERKTGIRSRQKTGIPDKKTGTATPENPSTGEGVSYDTPLSGWRESRAYARPRLPRSEAGGLEGRRRIGFSRFHRASLCTKYT